MSDTKEEDKRRLEETLLRIMLQALPESKGMRLYERGIICPTEAANQLLKEWKEK